MPSHSREPQCRLRLGRLGCDRRAHRRTASRRCRRPRAGRPGPGRSSWQARHLRGACQGRRCRQPGAGQGGAAWSPSSRLRRCARSRHPTPASTTSASASWSTSTASSMRSQRRPAEGLRHAPASQRGALQQRVEGCATGSQALGVHASPSISTSASVTLAPATAEQSCRSTSTPRADRCTPPRSSEALSSGVRQVAN